MASSAESGLSMASSDEQNKRAGTKTDICDTILSTHRSMPDKTVKLFTSVFALFTWRESLL